MASRQAGLYPDVAHSCDTSTLGWAQNASKGQSRPSISDKKRTGVLTIQPGARFARLADGGWRLWPCRRSGEESSGLLGQLEFFTAEPSRPRRRLSELTLRVLWAFGVARGLPTH